jgi:hypothetical protein
MHSREGNTADVYDPLTEEHEGRRAGNPDAHEGLANDNEEATSCGRQVECVRVRAGPCKANVAPPAMLRPLPAARGACLGYSSAAAMATAEAADVNTHRDDALVDGTLPDAAHDMLGPRLYFVLARHW